MNHQRKSHLIPVLALILGLLLSSGPAVKAAEITIMTIQGTGQFSPFAGQVVETTGVVTLFTASGSSCWIQDPHGDGNPQTSDGIFVSGCAFPDEGPAPEVGDLIHIVAEVEEQQFGNALPLTRLTDVQQIGIFSSNNPLPEPVPLVDLPDVSIPEGIEFWEPLEGMRVVVRPGRVVAPTNSFGEFTMLAREDAQPGSGFFFPPGHLLLRSLGNNEVDYNPERIIVDDSSLQEAIIVRPGDKVLYLDGVVDYTFGNYKIQPDNFDVTTRPLPNAPVSRRMGGDGNTKITTYNVENLFDLEDNPDKDDIGTGGAETPEELEAQLAKLALAIKLELQTPEILIVQEVENTEILQELGDRLNADTGTAYVATSFETSDERGIEVGFLWDANRVELLDAFQLSDAIVPGVSDAFGPDSASPGREPLVGIFSIEGDTVTIVGNHFKSKSGDDPLFGVNWPPVRITEEQRKAQARVVRDYVNLIFDEDPNALVMVAGDLNDFEFPEPGEGETHPLGILEGDESEVPLTNLIFLEPKRERFTFIFDGNSQVLDHMLVSPALLQQTRAADILHFNTPYPAVLGDNTNTTLHASDHDPVEGRFHFGER